MDISTTYNFSAILTDVMKQVVPRRGHRHCGSRGIRGPAGHHQHRAVEEEGQGGGQGSGGETEAD